MGMPQAIHRFTVDEFQRMGRAGVFHEDDRVELIDGQVVELTPIGPEHQSCVDRLANTFAQRLGPRAVVRVQGPVIVGEHWQPQPDLALLDPPVSRYHHVHPGPDHIRLVVEVAETSAAFDREAKLPQYARGGLVEAWLVNLPADALEVYREPREGSYRQVRTLRRGDAISPLAFPDLGLEVSEILGS